MRNGSYPLTKDTVFRVPSKVIAETEKHLKAAGRGQTECTVFWGGIGTGASGEVKSVYRPSQTATAASVVVHPDAVHKMYEELIRRNEILLAQIHTHPGTAFHSETDDSFPATFLVGFLSIVVPNFCHAGLNQFDTCGIFVHRGMGEWSRLSIRDVSRRLIIGGTNENEER